MRLEIINKTKLAEAQLNPLLELAARFCNYSGKVQVTVHWSKRQWANYHPSGWCMHGLRVPRVRLGLVRPENFKPREVTTLGYFRSHAIPLLKPYSVTCWEECVIDIAAHEFGHLMPRGNAYRKSVIEKFCEERVARAIEYYRTPEGRQEVAASAAAYLDRVSRLKERVAIKKAEKRDPNIKIAKLEATRKRWVTKAKRAATALKKIDRQLRRLRKEVDTPPNHGQVASYS